MLRLPCAGLVLGLALTPLSGAQDIPADTEIVELESGLKYSVLTPGGPGASPRLTDPVTVHYTGWFEDGRVFDSSRRPRIPGTPVVPSTFKVGGVVEGWNIALQKMTPGARWKLTIPSDLGYGDQGGQGIPGGATLIFDVELISFEKGPGVPPFKRPDAATAKKLEGGVMYECSKPGDGSPIDENNISLFHYTMYSMDGERLESSLFRPRALKLSMKDAPPFLKVAAKEMKPGAEAYIEVPAEANPGADQPVVFHVSLLNKVMPDVATIPWKKTESGLEYHIVAPGEGERAKSGDQVTCHYTGWLTDGVLFDSSAGSDPATFPLQNPGGVIQGWVEGLSMLNVGGRIMLRIPPDLGYGDAGRGSMISAGATLIFDVKLKGREGS